MELGYFWTGEETDYFLQLIKEKTRTTIFDGKQAKNQQKQS